MQLQLKSSHKQYNNTWYVCVLIKRYLQNQTVFDIQHPNQSLMTLSNKSFNLKFDFRISKFLLQCQPVSEMKNNFISTIPHSILAGYFDQFNNFHRNSVWEFSKPLNLTHSTIPNLSLIFLVANLIDLRIWPRYPY